MSEDQGDLFTVDAIAKIRERQEAIERERKEAGLPDKNPEKPKSPGRGSSGKDEPVQFYVLNMTDCGFKDDPESMDVPFFSISNNCLNVEDFFWETPDGQSRFEVVEADAGRPTQKDKDLVIFVMSQLVAAENRGEKVSRRVRLKVADYLTATNRRVSGGSRYAEIEKSLDRICGYRVKFTKPQGDNVIIQNVAFFTEYKIIRRAKTGRLLSVEIVVSDWVMNKIEKMKVLTISPDYFTLSGNFERRVYEIARKTCGAKPFTFLSMDKFKAKTGSVLDDYEFRRKIRQIIKADSLPDYRLKMEKARIAFYAKDPKKLIRMFSADIG